MTYHRSMKLVPTLKSHHQGSPEVSHWPSFLLGTVFNQPDSLSSINWSSFMVGLTSPSSIGALDVARGWQCPFVLCLHPQGCLQRGFRASGSFQPHRWKPTRLPRPWDCKEIQPVLSASEPQDAGDGVEEALQAGGPRSSVLVLALESREGTRASSVDVVWGLPRCVWARESTAPAQGMWV